MRLIDADELIKRMRKWMPKDPCGREQTVEEVVATDIAASVFMEIEETPTAFDKEKVIEELKEMATHSASCKNQCEFGSTEYFDYMGAEVAYKTTIEIIEKGGIE